MKTFLTEYFYYTRAERNGALVLGVLCLALFVAPSFFSHIFPKKETPDFELVLASDREMASAEPVTAQETNLFEFDPNIATKEDFENLGLSTKLAQTIINYRNKGGKFYRSEDLQKIYNLDDADYERLKPFIRIGATPMEKTPHSHFKNRELAQLFEFDPNTISKEGLIQFGLSEKIAETIVKYRNKGGTFHKPEDLKKIYGLQDDDYQRLIPYIKLPEPNQIKTSTITTTEVKSPDFPTRAAQPLMIDVNQASTADWQQLRGIGIAFAKRITNFRDKLGGFSNIEQVSETYGLPDSTFQAIKFQLKWSPVFRKIAINRANVEELKAHPYISARLAATIISYREQHGAFASSESLAGIKAISAASLEKLKPYLNFE